jgi:hypothetical protein
VSFAFNLMQKKVEIKEKKGEGEREFRRWESTI